MTHVFHSSVNNITPWQAQYSFPSQATKIGKQTVQIQPKSGQSYKPGETIRIEFPSDGYLNMLNSVLMFDVSVTNPLHDSYLTTMVASGAAYTLTAASSSIPAVTWGSGLGASYTSRRATAHGFRGYFLVIEDGPTNIGQSFLVASSGTDGTVNLSSGNGVAILPDGTYTVKLWSGTRLQGSAHELFKRVRWTYGGIPLEDHPEYPTMVRALMDAGVADEFKKSAGAILDGTACSFADEGLHPTFLTTHTTANHDAIKVAMDQNLKERTVMLNLFTGLSTCKKLIPLKWMAASLVLELTLATPAEALIAGLGSTATNPPTFSLNRVNYLAELLEFDSTYDTAFYMGLKNSQGPDGAMVKGGVPLKFSSWNYHNFNLTGKDNVFQIHERARSVKAAFAVIRDQTAHLARDSNRFYHDAGVEMKAPNDVGYSAPSIVGTSQPYAVDVELANADAFVEEYQWRLGGRYYPAQPVKCGKGGAEAYVELLKTVDALGDYTFSSGMSPRNWSSYHDKTGGDKFIIAAEFEHTDVMPDTVAGINAEEMSDLTLILKLAGQPVGKKCDVMVHYDSLIIIRDMNQVDLVL